MHSRYSFCTVGQLMPIAKARGIVGRWSMTKAELIRAIEATEPKESIMLEEETSTEDDRGLQQTTSDYLDNIGEGTILAFKVDTRKGQIALSGKLVRKYDNDEFLIATKQGTHFRVQKSNILWVKTGRRWPKWVFEQFGCVPEEGQVLSDAL